MKAILPLILLCLLLPEKGSAQVTSSPNTFYIIPPTSGCNGIWAVDYTVTCSSPLIYNISPNGCASIDHYNGDTLFLNLCNIPCDLAVIDNTGSVCMACWILPPASGISDNNLPGTKLVVHSYPKENLITILGKVGRNSRFVLSNILGKEILSEILNDQSDVNQVHENNLANGIYFWKVISNNRVQSGGKVTISN